MKVNGINGVNAQAGQAGRNQAVDSYSKNIQRQIANAQKQLQDLSANEDLTLEEKMKKRQEIQQEITNLNQQLRQHQIEQRKERQSNGTSMNDMIGKSQSPRAARPGSKGNGLSQESMQAMISADASMKQAQVQGGVATRMEGRAGVLEAEIKMDQSKGVSTEAKEAELAEVEQKAMNAAASQVDTLADANQEMQEAAKAEQGSKEEKTDTKTESKEEKSGQEEGKGSENTTGTEAETNPYTHVDIRL